MGSALVVEQVDLCDMVLAIARALTGKHEGQCVTAEEHDGSTVILLSVAAEDIGKIIGKSGRTVRAIRVIVQAASMAQKRHYTLNIAEKTD